MNDNDKEIYSFVNRNVANGDCGFFSLLYRELKPSVICIFRMFELKRSQNRIYNRRQIRYRSCIQYSKSQLLLLGEEEA